jgi:hypothetical protein
MYPFSFLYFNLSNEIIERFWSEDSSRETSIRTIVRTTSILDGIIREIIEMKVHKTPFLCTSHNTRGEIGFENFREKGNDVDDHLKWRKILPVIPSKEGIFLIF